MISKLFLFSSISIFFDFSNCLACLSSSLTSAELFEVINLVSLALRSSIWSLIALSCALIPILASFFIWAGVSPLIDSIWLSINCIFSITLFSSCFCVLIWSARNENNCSWPVNIVSKVSKQIAVKAVPAIHLIIHDFAYRKPVTKGIFKSSVKATPIKGKVPTKRINFVSSERILLSPVTPI